jgi:hypothetical protein
MLYGFAVAGVGFVGYAAYYFVRESNRLKQDRLRPRQPWELG